MACEDLQNLLRIPFTSFCRNHMTEDDLRAIVMQARIEPQGALGTQEPCFNRPSREAASHLLNITLCITAADSEGVKFHQLTGIVFVRVALKVLRIVKVSQHR